MPMQLDELLEYVENQTEDLLNSEEVKTVRGNELGLDSRVGRVYVGENFIAVPIGNRRMIDYYGGFEYIDAEFVRVLDKFVFYMADDDEDNRVANALEHYRESKKDQS